MVSVKRFEESQVYQKLEMVICNVDWEGGININNESSHLRFEEDLLIVITSYQLQAILNEQNNQILVFCLGIKSKFICLEPHGRIVVGSDEIEEVKRYI